METGFLALMSALAVSLVLIPLATRLAPRLGFMDVPDPRKVHAAPVPRVGGWGIWAGTCVAIVVWIPPEPVVTAFLLGATILFLSGVWDDRAELGHYAKFAAQIAAVGIFVIYGGVYVSHVPIIDAELSPVVGIPFTMFALVGVINAINHSDGLDGLAGGESALSLIGLTHLAFFGHGTATVGIAMAALGGLVGFLRYNTHPASVFMGDSGSQVLGFTLGALAVLLTQRADPALSPALVLLLLGLPLADIIYVLWRRIREGRNWFRATKNHVHHRLLERGLRQKESVTVIYSVQCLLVFGAVSLRYSSDWLIIGVYLLACAMAFVSLRWAELHDWRARPANHGLLRIFAQAKRSRVAIVASRRFLQMAIPIYLILTSATATTIHGSLAMTGAMAFSLLLISSIFLRGRLSLLGRALIYVVCSLVVYLSMDTAELYHPWFSAIEIAFFGLLMISIGVTLRSTPARRASEFRTTAMDYLVVLVLWMGWVLILEPFAPLHTLMFKLVVLLYGCEVLIVGYRERWQKLAIPSMAAAGIVMLRGML